MSRSYKKNPISKCDPKNGTPGKKFANRKVRRCKDAIPNGKAYRKIYNSWEIHDYVCRYTYEEYNCHYEAQIKMYQAGGLCYNPDKYEHSHYNWYRDYKRK